MMNVTQTSNIKCIFMFCVDIGMNNNYDTLIQQELISYYRREITGFMLGTI